MRIQAIIFAVGVALLMYGFTSADQNSKNESQAQKLFSRAKPDDFMGDQGCAECHPSTTTNFAKSGHASMMADPHLPLDKRGCEGCHGPGHIHQAEQNPEVISFTKMTPKESSAACLRCHNDLMNGAHWNITAHAKANVACVSCHQIHPKEDAGVIGSGSQGLVLKQIYPAAKVTGKLLKADEATLCSSCHKSEVAQFRQSSHHPVPEGRLVCSDCHSIHPTNAARKQASDVKEKCVACHAEMAGPFAFEHDPVAGFTGGGCDDCHKPHGSHNPRLLKAFSRGLCSQCHTDKGINHFGGKTCWSAGCHVAIHGSNTDSKFLHR